MRCTGRLGSSRGQVFTLPRCRRLLLWGRKPRCPCRGAENLRWDWGQKGREVKAGVSLVGWLNGSRAQTQRSELETLDGVLVVFSASLCPLERRECWLRGSVLGTEPAPSSLHPQASCFSGLSLLGPEGTGPHCG